jgi:hypothetical protein
MNLPLSLVVLLFLTPSLALGQAPDKIDEQLRSPTGLYMLGILKKYEAMGREVNRYCHLQESTYPKYNKVLFISGFVTCKPSYGRETGFYEVFEGDDKFLVSEDKLEVNLAEAAALKQLEGDVKEAFALRAHRAAVSARQHELKTLLDAVKSHQKYGLTVASAGIEDESEYTSGTSFSIEVINPTGKIVKYLWFTVTGYNAVGDPVRDRVRNASAITVKAIGPIQPSQSGKYNFTYLWHTDLVQTYKINKIKIQYMDGSMGQIDNIKAITFDAGQRRMWSEMGD